VSLLIPKEERLSKTTAIVLVNQAIISTGIRVVKLNVMLLYLEQVTTALITVSILVKTQNISIKIAHAALLVTVLTSRDMKAIKTIVMLLVILVSTCTSTEAVLTNVTFLLSREVKEADFSVIILVRLLITYIGMVLAQAVTSPLSNT